MDEEVKCHRNYEVSGIIFSNILISMGIENYDFLLPVALNEIASRFAAELLTDAKDYALHSSREYISSEDINIAAKLYDSNGMHDGTQALIQDMKDKINKKPLIDLLKKDSIKIKYPSKFLQRPVTIIPGNDAYGRIIDIQGENRELTPNNVSSNKGPSAVENSSSVVGEKRFALQLPEGAAKKKLLPAKSFENAE